MQKLNHKFGDDGVSVPFSALGWLPWRTPVFELRLICTGLLDLIPRSSASLPTLRPNPSFWTRMDHVAAMVQRERALVR